MLNQIAMAALGVVSTGAFAVAPLASSSFDTDSEGSTVFNGAETFAWSASDGESASAAFHEGTRLHTVQMTSAAPEPTSNAMWMGGAGLLALLVSRRRD